MIMHYTEQLHCIANYKSKVTRSRVVTSRPTFTGDLARPFLRT